jgi:hypothetical protein
VIHLQLLDHVTPDEIVGHMREIEQCVKVHAPETVHLIVDFSGIGYLPTNIHFLSDVSRPLAGTPNFGHIVTVKAKLPLIATLAMIVGQIVHFKHQTVQSLDEALVYLNDIDSDIKMTV